jgi:2-C-methyl-D-erythritol 4-phosphate cytidylyltransferase
MKFTRLFGFVIMMWIMILAEAAFLVFLVPPLDSILLINGYSRLIVSSIEALISISSVVMVILVLNKMKNAYMQKKLEL